MVRLRPALLLLEVPPVVLLHAQPLRRKIVHAGVNPDPITGAVLTEIAPFNLTTEKRGAYHQRKFARTRREEEERENVARPAFRAKPVPAEQQAGVSITRTQLAAMLRRGSGMSR